MSVQWLHVRQAGTWDPLLQCGDACAWTHLSSKRQNTKKLYGTKNTCKVVRADSEQKIQLPVLKNQEQKQGTTHAPCTQHHLKARENHASSLTPRHTTALAQYQEQAPLGEQATSKEICGFFLAPCAATETSIKALPEFLVWPLISFY